MSPEDEELTYNYTVRNSGPAASTNTVVRSTLDRAVSFVSATPADKCAHSGGATGGVVTCRFDALNSGASEAGEIVVQVGPAASTDIVITSVATGNELDRRPGDNTATASTELFAPPEQVMNLSPASGVASLSSNCRGPGPQTMAAPSPDTSWNARRPARAMSLVTPGP